MAVTGCGCKICKANLGDYTNQLIIDGVSPKEVLQELESKSLKTTEKLLKKHLSAYQIPYPENKNANVISTKPVEVDLNKIDFSEYDFEPTNIESIIHYLQKINLKIYLNQTRITLQAQQDVIDGVTPDMPREIMQNLAIAFQILEKSTGMNIHINQQEAIKTVELMGLIVQSPSTYLLPSNNVQRQTESETD